jgi:hypothetical protein
VILAFSSDDEGFVCSVAPSRRGGISIRGGWGCNLVKRGQYFEEGEPTELLVLSRVLLHVLGNGASLLVLLSSTSTSVVVGGRNAGRVASATIQSPLSRTLRQGSFVHVFGERGLSTATTLANLHLGGCWGE